MIRTLLLTIALLTALPLQANTLQELRETLTRLAGTAPLKANVQIKSEGRVQGDDETESNIGLASAQLEDGPQGLRLSYAQAVLSKAAQEEAARATNPKALTPTATGLKNLGYSDMRDLSRAAENLRRDLATAQLKSERSESWQGQPARVLVFDVPQAKKSKFLKNFESTLEVWLAADGTPLASKARQRMEVSAFVVLSFEMHNSEEQVFNVIGDRLVSTRRVTTNSGSGSGQKSSGKREYLLQPIS